MKILSINDAIEKGLLNHIGGVSLKEDAKIMQVKDKEELEETIKSMLKNVTEPSIVVSDDEQEIFCVTVEREHNNSRNFFEGAEKSTQKYIYPRVYTQDNTPTLIMGQSAKNKYSTIPIVQDNKNEDIQEFTLKIQNAKGSIDETYYEDELLQGNEQNVEIEETEVVHKLEQPIEVSYENGVLQLKGNNTEIEDGDTVIINKNNFIDYTYSIELADGSESNLTFGYNMIPDEYTFCKDIVNKINKIKTEGIGNIKEDSIKCVGYEETEEKYYESTPKEVEIIEPEDEELKKLLDEDKKLDEKITEAQNTLNHQRDNGTVQL